MLCWQERDCWSCSQSWKRKEKQQKRNMFPSEEFVPLEHEQICTILGYDLFLTWNQARVLYCCPSLCYLIPWLSTWKQLSEQCLHWRSFPFESVQPWTFCAWMKKLSMSTSVSKMFWSLLCDMSLGSFFQRGMAFSSSPPHSTYCYPILLGVQSSWQLSGTRPFKSLIKSVL